MTTLLNTDFFRCRNLHAVDVAAIPDRLEDAVAETKYHDVLNCLFAEVVIDSVNLIFTKHLHQLLIELSCRINVRTEGLLDHDPAEMPICFFSKVGSAQLFDDGRKVLGRSR